MIWVLFGTSFYLGAALFPGHFTLLLPPLFLGHFRFSSLPYFHATSYCSSPAPISMPLHVVPLSPLFPCYFTLFLSLPYFHATSHCSSLPPISKPLHIVSLSSPFPGHFIFPSLLYFQSTSHYFPVSPTATSKHVLRRGNTAPVAISSVLHKLFILVLYLYFLTSFPPYSPTLHTASNLPRCPGVHRKHEELTFLW